MKIREALQAIGARRQSQVLVLAASNLEMDFLPPLYDSLCGIGRVERLDVVISCRGGEVGAARRIALLLHDFAEHLAFLVPHHCESAGTIMALAAHEIVAGPVAIFSPVDPQLHGGPGDGPPAVSIQDVRLFADMARDWFGFDEVDARGRALSTLSESFFPTTLTAFYRSTLESQAICEQMVALGQRGLSDEGRAAIVRQLMFGYHSHGYALTRGDLETVGLPIRHDPLTEDLAWSISRALAGQVGGGTRRTPTDDWRDAAVLTQAGGQCRRRTPANGATIWEPAEIA